MTNQLTSFYDFVSFTHDVRAIKRSMWVRTEEQYENDSEHSFQVAMVALHLIEANQLKLDPFKAMGLALVHDVLEVYAGDTPIFADETTLATKAQREQEAIKSLKENFPNMPVMHSLIDEYEKRETSESKFVYAIDKLLPIANNYLDNGRNWKKNNVTLEQIIEAKDTKIAIDSTVYNYYEKLVNDLRQHPEMFP